MHIYKRRQRACAVSPGTRHSVINRARARASIERVSGEIKKAFLPKLRVIASTPSLKRALRILASFERFYFILFYFIFFFCFSDAFEGYMYYISVWDQRRNCLNFCRKIAQRIHNHFYFAFKQPIIFRRDMKNFKFLKCIMVKIFFDYRSATEDITM